MTCPVVRVAKMGEGEVDVGKELKEEDDGWGVVVNLEVELAEIEEVMPTFEDQQQVSLGVDAKWKTRQRLRNSPRKEVEKLIKDVDHTICGPPCEELPMPDCIKALNAEFAAIFPARIPGGMPQSMPMDHRIDLVQDHEIPWQKLYRSSPAEDKELQEQLSSLEKLCFLCQSQMGSFGYVWTIDC